MKKLDNSTAQPLPTSTTNAESHSPFIESLHLMDAVKLIDSLKSLLFNAPEVDQTKIDFFKNEVLMNNYKINTTQIAQQLLEQVQITLEPELA